MLSKEDNELYTRVGPGTRMGELFRRFWLPVLLVSDLLEPDGPPVRIRLLCEDLVAFRDTNGKVGIIEERCAHRQASLYFGRNEECGLRCVYHGWKFDTEGRCVDMPNEPESSRFKERIRLRSYPVREAADLIWVYMGPPELEPELPDFEWMRVPSEQRIVARWLQESNWAQGLEGEIDASHLSFLHQVFEGAPAQIQNPSPGLKLIRDSGVGNPELAVRETDYGCLYAAHRGLSDGRDYWRIGHWLMPSFSLVPSSPVFSGRVFVPIDDENCRTIHYAWLDRPFTQAERDEAFSGAVFPPRLIPGTEMPLANRRNDYLIDRELQRTGNFTGIWGVSDQDRAVQESMGPIVDRTKEHLGSADRGVLAARRMLIRAAQDLQNGMEPKAATDGSLYAVLPYLNIEVEQDLERFLARHRTELVSRID